jgi:hypothetical protein
LFVPARSGVVLNLCKQGSVADSKDFCNRIVRNTFVLAIFYQIANAKSEFAKLRKNIGGAERRQFLRALGVLRGLPLNPLSWFILSRMRKNEHNRSASARSSVSACRRNLRSKEKAQTALPVQIPTDEQAIPRR